MSAEENLKRLQEFAAGFVTVRKTELTRLQRIEEAARAVERQTTLRFDHPLWVELREALTTDQEEPQP